MALRSRRTLGFTLLEMLGVLAVLAILISLTLPVLRKSRAVSKVSKARADIVKIESALNLFKMEYGVDPTAASGFLKASGTHFTILSGTTPLSPSTNQHYLNVPEKQTTGSDNEFIDPWGTTYWIRMSAPTNNNPNHYDVFSSGPDKTIDTGPPGTGDDITNWSR